jgi:PAS domain S-box-containing protein
LNTASLLVVILIIPFLFLAVAHELAASGRAEEKVREVERLEDMLDGGPVAIMEGYLSKDGRFTRTYISRSAARISGWSWDDVAKTGILALKIDPETNARKTCTFLKLFKDGAVRLRFELQRPDGSWIWIQGYYRVTESLPDGRARVIAQFVDVTAEELAIEREASARAEIHQKIETMLGGLPAVVFLRRVNPDGTTEVEFRGGDVETVMGWHPDDLARFPNLAALAVASPISFDEWLKSVVADGQHTLEWEMQQPDGSLRWMRSENRVLERGEDGTTLFAGYHTNVTARRRAEEQALAAARLASLGEMAASIVHELRQPLSTILIAADNADAAISDRKFDRARAGLDRISNQATKALRVIDHLRGFAHGGRDEPLEVIKLNELVNGVIDILKPVLAEANINIQFDRDGYPGSVIAQRLGLEQVMTNLLVNSRDAIVGQDAQSARWIRIELAHQGDTVETTISDSGGGIPSAVMKRLFQPFVTTKPIGLGTGLGLSISHGLIRAMQGSISVTNQPAGAEVIIKLQFST